MTTMTTKKLGSGKWLDAESVKRSLRRHGLPRPVSVRLPFQRRRHGLFYGFVDTASGRQARIRLDGSVRVELFRPLAHQVSFEE
jgi:hypothetical protein